MSLRTFMARYLAAVEAERQARRALDAAAAERSAATQELDDALASFLSDYTPAESEEIETP